MGKPWENEEGEKVPFIGTGAASVIVDRKHITDGSPCWCNPEVIHVPPSKGVEGFYLNNDPVLINVSGVSTEPLWVDPIEVAAIGVRGEHDTLIVLKGSGTQLVAKSMHPNEVAQAVCGIPEKHDDATD